MPHSQPHPDSSTMLLINLKIAKIRDNRNGNTMFTYQSNLLAGQPASSSSFKSHLKKVFTTRAAYDDPDPTPSAPAETDSDFEARLSRLRYRSGTGKKAEVRKTRKSTGPKGSNSQSGGVFLPPVALKEPVSGGLKVDFGFSPYSERLNGRIASLGLAALLLVELATGQSAIKFHSAPIIFLQVYFVAAVTAVYVKFEKERVSVWPSAKE